MHNSHIKATFEIVDAIGIITISDPPANKLVLPEFIPVNQFLEWTSNPILKGLIVKGEGRNFSLGGDLEAIFKMAHDPETLNILMADGHRLMNAIQNLDLPVVAAINRVCFGGGLEIALACHIRVASENAMFAFPEVNQNLLPGMGGTVRLPALTGFSHAAMMILGGDTVNATDAKKLGIIDIIAPKDQAFDYATDLLRKMTHDRPVTVVRSVMQALKNAPRMSGEDAMRAETRLFCALAKEEAVRRKMEDS